MIETKFDSVRLSREATSSRPAGVAPAWIPLKFKRYYDFLKKWAGVFGKEMKEDREEELIKAVVRSVKGDI